MKNETKVFLNTWGNYNNGGLGFGWMTPEEAIEFMDGALEDEEFIAAHGEEFCIVDIDNYTELPLDRLSVYADARELCETFIDYECLADWKKRPVAAVMVNEQCSLEEACMRLEYYTWYEDEEAYLDACDEFINEALISVPDWVRRFFDWDGYHKCCMDDGWETPNGIILVS